MKAPMIAAIPPSTSAAQAYTSIVTKAKANRPWLTGSFSTKRPSFGISQMPTAEATARYRSILRRTNPPLARPSIDPLAESARNRDTPRTAKESSIAAAPRRLTPTRVRSIRSSIRVWAEMPMLVGAKSRPKNRACRGAKEKANARAAPSASVRANPRAPANAATLPDLIRSETWSSNPAMNINNKTPSSAR